MLVLADAEVRELFRAILRNRALIMGALCALPACREPERLTEDRAKRFLLRP